MHEKLIDSGTDNRGRTCDTFQAIIIIDRKKMPKENAIVNAEILKAIRLHVVDRAYGGLPHAYCVWLMLL